MTFLIAFHLKVNFICKFVNPFRHHMVKPLLLIISNAIHWTPQCNENAVCPTPFPVLT